MLYIFNAGFLQNFLYTVNVLEKDAASCIVEAGSGDVDFHLGDHPSRSGSHDQHPISQDAYPQTKGKAYDISDAQSEEGAHGIIGQEACLRVS